MGIKITKNTLGRFGGKIERGATSYNADDIATALATSASQFIADEYNASNVSGVTIHDEPAKNGATRVTASKEGLAYIEYGVGNYARGTYQGELPKETITFESPKGEQHSTSGWEYYYPNPKTKTTIGGQHGWFISRQGGIFTAGHIAGNQMYYAADTLRKEAKNIVKKVIKGEGVK